MFRSNDVDTIEYNNTGSAELFMIITLVNALCASMAGRSFKHHANTLYGVSKEALDRRRKDRESREAARDFQKFFGISSQAAMARHLREKGLSGTSLPAMQSGQILQPLYGQEHVSKAVDAAIAEWLEEGPNAPLSILFSGPSGTGKTQTAENIAQSYGRELVQFNMPEYSGGAHQEEGPTWVKTSYSVHQQDTWAPKKVAY